MLPTTGSLARWLREPMLHFLALGALLFVVYGWVNPDMLREPSEIVVDQAQVEALANRFQRVWQRPPDHDELQGLIDAWVRDEILFREGVAIGMDRDDEVVRRRVVQKMIFLNESLAAEVPTEAELQAWLDAHPDDYRMAPHYLLRQLYFDPLRHDDDLQHAIAGAMKALQRNPDARLGDTTLLPAELVDASAEVVARTFGAKFADALPDLPDGRWAGPVESGFGLHLVRIDARVPERVPELAQVRGAVERDLLNARNRQANEAFQDALRSRYTVRIEADTPAPSTGSSVATGTQ